MLFALLGLMQAPGPVIEPGSIYGMKTFTTNPSFGFLPDKIAAAFAPNGIEGLTMHVLKGETEVVGGPMYVTETPYEAFKVLRFSQPTVELAEAGAYVIEFRYQGKAASRFPFEIRKASSGDEFNSTTAWSFITPVDRMGSLSFSSVDDGHVWMNAWTDPVRDQLALKSTLEATLSAGGKVVAHAHAVTIHEAYNMRRGFKMMKVGGQAAFKKSDLLGLSGVVTGKLTSKGKVVREFKWTVSGGKVELHKRSESSFSPRTDYWVPRRLAGSPEGHQFFHLEEHHWSESK